MHDSSLLRPRSDELSELLYRAAVHVRAGGSTDANQQRCGASSSAHDDECVKQFVQQFVKKLVKDTVAKIDG